MNFLVLGSGGREHVFCWKLAKSRLCSQIYAIPGNAGTALYAQNYNIDINNFEDIKTFVLDKKINLLLVGPEEPLVNGIHDYFLKDELLKNIHIIGPQKEAAKLEGSKFFAKEFMTRNNIPTAKYGKFNKENINAGEIFLESLSPPYVLKADGLAAGKGVLIINDLDEAKLELRKMLLEKKFGKASETVVIEEFLEGIELSCFVLTDGNSHLSLPMAKDYKRIGEGDKGLNTGGMGAVSPVSFVTRDFSKKIENNIIKPTIEGLKKEGIPYKGFIFIGLIKVGNEPKVIEYNVRMGDPETQVVLPRIKNDFAEILTCLAEGKLDSIILDIDEKIAVTVVAVSGGYPQEYKRGKTIYGLDLETESLIFHAGTETDSLKTITSGGRVLAITSFGKNVQESAKKSYSTLKNIKFKEIYFRKDIGFDL
jgi:phosphoribosylamine--glycine ligase